MYYGMLDEEIQYVIDGQMLGFDILEELGKENNQSILDSVEETIEKGTRTGKVNEQAQAMKARQQEKMNPDIEKDNSNKSLDD